jgi:hypothetical protein
MLVVESGHSTSFLFRLQHPFTGVFSVKESYGEYMESERDMQCSRQPLKNNR